MFFKKIIFFILLGIALSVQVHAQDDVCDAVNAIITDAPNKFRNIRGNLVNAGSSATIWECTIKVPGTINSRFVASMGLFYEGAFFQSKDKEELKARYDKCKEMLGKCFSAGYKMSFHDNFYPGLSDYKKVVFMPVLKDDAAPGSAPPHIAMEATYNKDIGYYTIVMYIFEH